MDNCGVFGIVGLVGSRPKSFAEDVDDAVDIGGSHCCAMVEDGGLSLSIETCVD